MDAIFDFMLRLTSDSIYTSLVAVPDPENMDIAVKILLLSRIYKLRYTICHMHFRFMTAIFDSLLTLTSNSIRISPVVLPDQKTRVQQLECRCYHAYKLK